VIRARQAMQTALDDTDPAPRLFAMLADGEGAPDVALPSTGVPITWERRLAAPLIVGADYGTRASTVVAIARDGAITFEERTPDETGAVVGTVRFPEA
jgi:uncharacterized protein with NRDE domain